RALGQCDFDYECPPQGSDVENNPLETFPNPRNTNGFIHCSHGIAYCKDCAATYPGTPALVWDDTKKQCERSVACDLLATSKWSACSKLCDGGTRQRTTTCSHLGSPITCNKCTNGKDVEIEACNTWSCPKCRRQVDIGLLLDSSGSIKEWDVVANAAAEFTEVMQNQDVSIQIGVVIFASDSAVVKSLNEPVTVDEIRTLKRTDGGTATSIGLNTMGQQIFNTANGDRPSAQNVVVVFTDGASDSATQTISAAQKLKNSGIEIYSVGVENANLRELEQMSSDAGHVFYTNNIRDLTEALYGALKAICPD
ncbi:unnamed protein product, partial [Didymodactylos carnosus]